MARKKEIYVNIDEDQVIKKKEKKKIDVKKLIRKILLIILSLCYISRT